MRKRDFFCALRKCEGVRAGRLGAAGGRQQLGAARSKIPYRKERDRDSEERRAKRERETVPRGTMHPSMKAATAKQGRGGDEPGLGATSGRVVREAERLHHLPRLLVAAAPSRPFPSQVQKHRLRPEHAARRA